MSVEDFTIDLPDDGIYPIRMTPFPQIRVPFSDTPEIKEYIDIYIQRAEYWRSDTLGSVHPDFPEATLTMETEVSPELGGLVSWAKIYSNAASWSSKNGGQTRFSYETISANYPAFSTWNIVGIRGLVFGGIQYPFLIIAEGASGYNLDVSQTSKTVIARVRETFYNTADPSAITLQSALKVIPSSDWNVPLIGSAQKPSPLTANQVSTNSGIGGWSPAENENELHQYSNPTRSQFLGATYWKPIDDRLERVMGNLWVKKEYLVPAQYPINNASAII